MMSVSLLETESDGPTDGLTLLDFILEEHREGQGGSIQLIQKGKRTLLCGAKPVYETIVYFLLLARGRHCTLLF